MIQCNIVVNNYIMYIFYNKSYKTQEAKHRISNSLLWTQYIMPLVIINAHKSNIMFLNPSLTVEI